MTQLAAENLGYGFAHRAVGENVSFTLAAGEVLAVLGPNGSGKTTLFRTLLGLLAPKSGRITLGARDLTQWPAHERARLLAYVPQAHASHFPFYVRDVVLMGRTPHLGLFSAPGKHDREFAAESLRKLQIAHLADSLYTEISGGERQLVLIARALASEAEILVMDEPTANLDFGNQALILEEILRLKASGKTVLFCTHHPDHAFLCADRALLLHGGRVLADGPPAEIINAAALKTLYGIDVRVADVADSDRPLRLCQPRLRNHPAP
jgi:iron complex transport system ATP-binding protein